MHRSTVNFRISDHETFYGSFEVSVLHFCHSNVKCNTVFVCENLLEAVFGLCCKGVLYTQIIAHIIEMFLQVFQDFVSYIVSCIVLTSLHTVVFIYYRIFLTVFSVQWISKYIRLMSVKISISFFLSHYREYINSLIITLDKLKWESLIILFGLLAGLHKFPIGKSRAASKK
jgi:hypothetical protein